MKKIVVLSKVPNLVYELSKILPNEMFHKCTCGNDPELKSAEILISDPDLLIPVMGDLTGATKWVQTTWAGVDSFVKQLNGPPPFTITRYSGEHFGKIMSEYVIASICNHERNYDFVCRNQQSKIWTKEGKISNYRIISDLNIGIMGVGNIGSYIGQILKRLGGNIFGLGRRETIDQTEANSYLEKYHSIKHLKEFLKECDYIVNVLPSSENTAGLLNGGILENCKERRAVFINIGRGSIVAEQDLLQALNNEWLSYAIIDVFEVEPLPANSLLWSMPQVKITPHVAGMSRAKDIAEQFSINHKLYLENKHIPTTLDLNAGY